MSKTIGQMLDEELRAEIYTSRPGGNREGDMWCVCWAGMGWPRPLDGDKQFVAHKGPPIDLEQAERLIKRGRADYPSLIFWMEWE